MTHAPRAPWNQCSTPPVRRVCRIPDVTPLAAAKSINGRTQHLAARPQPRGSTPLHKHPHFLLLSGFCSFLSSSQAKKAQEAELAALFDEALLTGVKKVRCGAVRCSAAQSAQKARRPRKMRASTSLD